jgi:hypothetical protein
MFESRILTSLLMEVSPMKVHSLGSSRGMLPLTAAYSQLHSSTGMIVVHEREKQGQHVWQPHGSTLLHTLVTRRSWTPLTRRVMCASGVSASNIVKSSRA